jgi:hypothetical protein
VLSGHHASRGVEDLAAAYRQLNSSVGQFATDTLKADTVALASNSAGDATFTTIESRLRHLADERDALANQIKKTLDQAEFGHSRPSWVTVNAELLAARLLLVQAHLLATHTA